LGGYGFGVVAFVSVEFVVGDWATTFVLRGVPTYTERS